MRNDATHCSIYRYRNKIYEYKPRGCKIKAVTEVDGVLCGELRKRWTGWIDMLLIAYFVVSVVLLRGVPPTPQTVQVPTSVYVIGNKLNIDVNNPGCNYLDAHISIKDSTGRVLYEECLSPGESIGEVEIRTDLSSYIIEYKVVLFNRYDFSKEYVVVNSSYKEN